MSGEHPPSGFSPSGGAQPAPVAYDDQPQMHPNPQYHQSQPPSYQQQLHQPLPAAQQTPQQLSDSAAMKLTRGTSCTLCQHRKVRCDKNKPCANCVKAGVECRVVPPQPPRRRKKRFQEREIIERLRVYEGMLAEQGIAFDPIGQDLRDFKGDNTQMEDVDDLENDFDALKTSPETSTSPSTQSQGARQKGRWLSLHKEFRASEDLLRDSSDEEAQEDGSTIHRAFDKMFDNQDGFPFFVGGRPMPVTNAHPPTIHILQLWQIYIDNINPLLKMTHVPSVQGKIIEATSRLNQAPKSIEALMFGMYVMAITALDEDEVEARFNTPKKDLLGKYFMALQQALVNASFMRVNDSITLQAYMLYLFAVRWFMDPRQLFCLIGVAVRVAHRMGLHRDPAGWGLPPYEVEQRRRLWWQIVGYDRRIGEMTGSTVTALSTGGDCKLPLNVNDSDLHIDGKEMPAPHTGPTEMLFALSTIELAMAVASNSNRDSFKMNNPDRGSTPAASSQQPNGFTVRLAGQEGPAYTLEGFCAHIEGTYLTHCDPKIPLHFFTLTMTRQALCKMRVVGFLVRMGDAEAMPIKEIEREDLFLQATQMIEYDNVVQSSDSLKTFRWYSRHHFPFPAYMFLVNEMRTRCTGPMVERAWDAIAVNYDLRGLLNNLHSPMHLAFSGLFIKAWAAHEEAQRNIGRDVTIPRFILGLREIADRRRKARAENRADSSLDQPPIDFPRASEPEPEPDLSGPGPGPGHDSIMTPPSDMAMAAAAAGGHGSMGPGMPRAGSHPGAPRTPSQGPPEFRNSMDWTYMQQGQNSFQSMPPGFGPFGSPMGGGMPGGMSGGMPGGMPSGMPGGMPGGIPPFGGMGGPPGGGPPGGGMYGGG